MKQITVTVPDDATVTTSGGEEYERIERQVQDQAVFQTIKKDRYLAYRDLFEAELVAVRAEVDAWAGKDSAAIKASLGQVIVPALSRTMRGLMWVGDYVFGANEDAGPT
jgi:hypothetical protein